MTLIILVLMLRCRVAIAPTPTELPRPRVTAIDLRPYQRHALNAAMKGQRLMLTRSMQLRLRALART